MADSDPTDPSLSEEWREAWQQALRASETIFGDPQPTDDRDAEGRMRSMRYALSRILRRMVDEE